MNLDGTKSFKVYTYQKFMVRCSKQEQVARYILIVALVAGYITGCFYPR